MKYILPEFYTYQVALNTTALFIILNIIKHLTSSVMVYCAHASRSIQENECIFIKRKDSKYSQTSTHSKLTPHLLYFQAVAD